MKTNKWHNTKRKMPKPGVPVKIKLVGGLERIAYFDKTCHVGIFLWVCEELSTFHSTSEVAQWQEWEGRGEDEVCPYVREA